MAPLAQFYRTHLHELTCLGSDGLARTGLKKSTQFIIYYEELFANSQSNNQCKLSMKIHKHKLSIKVHNITSLIALRIEKPDSQTVVRRIRKR